MATTPAPALFSSADEAITAFKARSWAEGHDFAVKERRNNAAGVLNSVRLRCARDCPNTAVIKRLKDRWEISQPKADAPTHNHPPTPPSAFSGYRLASLARYESRIAYFWRAGMRPQSIMTALRVEGEETGEPIQFDYQDLVNNLQVHRRAELAGRTPIQWLFDQLDGTSDFFYSDRRDSNGRIQCLFIAPKSALPLYEAAPEVIAIDCTYKTNRFNLPLLNICGILPFRKSFSIAVAFLNHEKQDAYAWALQALGDYLEGEGLPVPALVVTDRELALLKALEEDERLCESPRLLCRWHVNMNVLAKTRSFFPKAQRQPDGKVKRHPLFSRFIEEWNALINSPTEEIFNERLQEFQQPRRHPENAVVYAVEVWIKDFKENLVKAWVNRHRNYGILTTSIVESLHAGMKLFINKSAGDLATVFRRLQLYWSTQARTLQLVRDKGMSKTPFGFDSILFADVRSKLVPHALRHVRAEIAAIPQQPRRGRWDLSPARPTAGPCGCSITTSHGIPCRHVIFNYLAADEHLDLGQFSRFWWWDRDADSRESTASTTSGGSPSRPGPVDPLPIRGKGRPRGAIASDKSTRRMPSAHDIAASIEAREALPPPSSAPAVLRGRRRRPLEAAPREAAPRDLYEPGTVAPRRSARIFSNLQAAAEAVDEPFELLSVPDGEYDDIPALDEGDFDALVDQALQEAEKARQETQQCIVCA